MFEFTQDIKINTLYKKYITVLYSYFILSKNEKMASLVCFLWQDFSKTFFMF